MACPTLPPRDLQDAAGHLPCPSRKRFPRKAALLLGASLAGLLVAAPALAQTATWTGGAVAGGDDSYTSGGNWAGGVAPVGTASTAIFGLVANRSLAIYAALDLGTLQISGASYYVANRSNDLLTISGGFDISGVNLLFENLLGTTRFLGGSASTARLFNDGGATLEFQNTATAGSAIISNSGTLAFYDGSSAGSATITSNGGIIGFYGDSLGGTASITLIGAQLDIQPHSPGEVSIGSITGDAASAITLGSNRLIMNIVSDTTFAGTITGGGGSLVKNGAGTLTLTGITSYTDGTYLNAGKIAIGSSGLSTATLYMADGTTLGSLANLTLSNVIWLGGGVATFDTGAFDLNLAGFVIGPGDLSKTGSGTLTLSGTSSYGSASRILGGTLLIANAAAVQSATIVTIATGAELRIADAVVATIAGLNGSTGGGLVTLGAGSGLNVIGSGAALSFGGNIRDGGDGSLTFGGTGGSQTLTGSSIIGGDLLVVGRLGICWRFPGRRPAWRPGVLVFRIPRSACPAAPVSLFPIWRAGFS